MSVAVGGAFASDPRWRWPCAAVGPRRRHAGAQLDWSASCSTIRRGYTRPFTEYFPKPGLHGEAHDQAGDVVLASALFGRIDQPDASLSAGRRLRDDIENSIVGNMPRESVGGQQQGVSRLCHKAA